MNMRQRKPVTDKSEILQEIRGKNGWERAATFFFLIYETGFKSVKQRSNRNPASIRHTWKDSKKQGGGV